MKPKEYKKKYNLLETDKFNHKEFMGDFTEDFNKMKYVKASVSQIDTLFSQIKDKFDHIFLETKVGDEAHKKLWSFIFATVLVPYRDEVCPEYKEEKEKRKGRKNSYYGFGWNFFDSFYSKLFEEFLRSNLKVTFTRMQACEIIGLTPFTLNRKNIISKYRELSLIHHPDIGGIQEKFIEITEAKEYLLSIIKE